MSRIRIRNSISSYMMKYLYQLSSHDFISKICLGLITQVYLDSFCKVVIFGIKCWWWCISNLIFCVSSFVTTWNSFLLQCNNRFPLLRCFYFSLLQVLNPFYRIFGSIATKLHFSLFRSYATYLTLHFQQNSSTIHLLSCNFFMFNYLKTNFIF